MKLGLKSVARVRWRRWMPKMKKPRWRKWTPNMERRWRRWTPKMKKKRWREWTPKMETRWRLSHVGGTNDSRSQSEKVERKEVNLPHLNKQKEKRTSRQRKDEGPTNDRNKFPNIYREDKRKIRESPHVAREEFEKGDEVLLLSAKKRTTLWGTIYRSLRNLTENRQEDIQNWYPRGKEADTSVSHKQIKEICPSRRPTSKN